MYTKANQDTSVICILYIYGLFQIYGAECVSPNHGSLMDFSSDAFTCSAPSVQIIHNYTVSLSTNVLIRCTYASDPAPVVTMGTAWHHTPLVTVEPNNSRSVTMTTAEYILQNISCSDLGWY